MSSDQQQPHEGHHGGWEPLPQGGEYEGDATAFVQLPDNLLDFTAQQRRADPLAAPGHGYVPPPIAQEHQQQHQAGPEHHGAADGQWTMPFAGEGQAPAAGGQWAPYGSHAPAGEGDWQEQGTAEQWSVPSAPEGADDSGEYLVGGPTAYAAAPHPGQPHWTPQAPAEGSWGGEQAAPAQDGHWQHAPAVDYGTGGEPAPDLNWNGSGEGWAAPADYPAHGDGTPAGEPGPDAGRPAGDHEGEAAAEHPSAGDAWAGGHPQDAAPAPAQPHAEPQGDLPEAGPHPDQDHGEAPGDAAPTVAEQHAEHAEPPEANAPEAGIEEAPQDGNAPDRAPESGTAEPATSPEAAPQAEHPAEEADGSGDEAAPAGAEPQSEHPLVSYVLKVNGTDRPVTESWIGESLLYVLRERLGLAGAKDGCSQGECGACSVLVDGRLVASCLVPAATAAASDIRTVEGLADHGASDVQRALAAHGAVQCGFCVPGLAMTVHDLLEGNHAPTELETRQAISGNLCRCSGYRGVLEAVREVAAERAARAEQEGEESGAPADGPADGNVRIPHQAGPPTTDHPTGGPA